jgi:hypothetical protein
MTTRCCRALAIRIERMEREPSTDVVVTSGFIRAGGRDAV